MRKTFKVMSLLYKGMCAFLKGILTTAIQYKCMSSNTKKTLILFLFFRHGFTMPFFHSIFNFVKSSLSRSSAKFFCDLIMLFISFVHNKILHNRMYYGKKGTYYGYCHEIMYYQCNFHRILEVETQSKTLQDIQAYLNRLVH